MKAIPRGNMASILTRTLDYADPRLVDHGQGVARIVHRALAGRGGWRGAALESMCLLALLHDVGAYKTEEIDQIVSFENLCVWDHSLYGYLYLKHFTPLAELAPALIYHHADHRSFGHLAAPEYEWGQILHVADRIHWLRRLGGPAPRGYRRAYLEAGRERDYPPAILDLFLECGAADEDEDPEQSRDYVATLLRRRGDMEEYLGMVVHAIDFRSPQTCAHSMAVAEASLALAEVLRLDREECEGIHAAAALHDLGKQGIPAAILESSHALSPGEMAVMRRHPSMTADILAGSVREDLRRIASRHHEKLNGSGYPEGLMAGDLTRGERLVAVADILCSLAEPRSYKPALPKDRVLDILGGMGRAGELDQGLIGLAADAYDFIMDRVLRVMEETHAVYETIAEEYRELRNWAESMEGGACPPRKELFPPDSGGPAKPIG